MPGSEAIRRLSVVLGMDSAGFTREATKVKKEVGGVESRFKALGASAKGLAAGFVGAISVDVLVQATTAAFDYASGLGEAATQIGITTKELQEYRYIATQVGVSQEEMDAGLAKLTRTLGDAAAGGNAQAKAFENLGVSIRDANGTIKSAGAIIPEVADAINKLPDPAQRAAALVDLFGKSGQKLAPLLAEGSEGINGMRQAYEKLGVAVTDEEIKNFDEAADKLSAIKQVMSGEFAKAIAANADEIVKLVQALSSLVSVSADALKFLDRLSKPRAIPYKDASFPEKILRDIDVITGGVDPYEAKLKRDGNFGRARGGRNLGRSGASAARGGTAGPIPASAFLPRPGQSRGPVAGGRLGAGGVLALSGIDFSQIPELAQYAVNETNRVWQSLSLLPPFTRQLDMTAEAFADWRQKLADDTQSIVDDLFPEEADRASIMAKFAQLDEALAEQLITPERWLEVRGRLGIELQKVQDQIDQSGVLIKPGDIEVGAVDTGIRELGRSIDENIGRGSENAAERASRAFSDLALDIGETFGGFKRGGLSGILQGAVGLASIAARFGAFGGKSQIPGFATGGSFRVGGAGGTDSKLMQFMATPGEMVNITRPGQSSGGGAMVFDLRGAVITEQLLGQINQMVANGEARAVRGGAKLATDQLQYNNRRRLG